jgi:hypothetical protein
MHIFVFIDKVWKILARNHDITVRINKLHTEYDCREQTYNLYSSMHRNHQ